MFKIAVCDDEKTYLDNIQDAIKRWSEERNVTIDIAAFDNGDSLLEHLKTEKLDMVFLDIMMPLFNGMELAHEIRKNDSVLKIVFLTSSPEFAVESYDVKASGYLLKPLSYDKLCRVLDDTLHEEETEPDNVILKTIMGYQKIYFHDIECIEAQNKKVVFKKNDGSSIEVFNTFSNFADNLTMEKGFFKCHRSYIVYIPNIDHFSPLEITTKSGLKIPVARGYSKDFKEAYFSYMFKKGSVK